MPNMRLGLSLHPHPRVADIGGTVIPYVFTGDAVIAGCPVDTPVGIFGFRQLRSTYFGPLVRIRRGNNDEKDFTFDPFTKWIDTQEVEDWVKAAPPLFGDNYGRVVRWYDQSGTSATDQVQSTWVDQPYVTYADGGACLNPSNGQLEMWVFPPEYRVKGADGSAAGANVVSESSFSLVNGKKGAGWMSLRPVGYNSIIWYALNLFTDIRVGFAGGASRDDQGFALRDNSADIIDPQVSRPASIAAGSLGAIFYDAGSTCLHFFGQDGSIAGGVHGLVVNDRATLYDSMVVAKNWSGWCKVGSAFRGTIQEVIFANVYPDDFTGGESAMRDIHTDQMSYLSIASGFALSDVVSLGFDGVGYVSIPETDFFASNYEPNRTCIITFKRSRSGVVEHLWSKTNASGYGETCWFDVDDYLNWKWTDGTRTAHFRSSIAFNDTDWHMVTLAPQTTGNLFRMYVDNSATNFSVAISQTPYTGILNVADREPLLIGMGPGLSDGFQGLINRLFLYYGVRGTDDHCELWGDGQPFNPRSSEDAGYLIYQWRFGNQDNRGIQRGILFDLHNYDDQHWNGTLVGLSETDLVADAPGGP